MEQAKPQIGDHPSPKATKRAFRTFLRFLTPTFIFILIWIAWRTDWEDIGDELLSSMGLRTADERPLSEEQLQIHIAEYREYCMRSSASFFPPPAWGFIDGDYRDTDCVYHPCKRALIYPQFTQVTCWPSVGGFWTTKLGPVDLDFLGLDRLKDTPRDISNTTKEDEFCDRLQRFGPTWYEDELMYRYFAFGITDEIPCDFPDGCPPLIPQKPRTLYGYPSAGGIWVLKLANETDLGKKGMGQLRNVFTMDERSTVIEAMGGKFYTNIDNYWALQEIQPVVFQLDELIKRSQASGG